MKTNIAHIIGILIIFILTSCEKESMQVTFPEKTFQLTFSMQDKISRVVDGDVITQSESKVTRVDLFFFNSTGKYVTKRMALIPEMDVMPSTSDKKWRMTVNVPLSDEAGNEIASGSYMVYAIANSDVATDNNLITNVNSTITGKGENLNVNDLENAFVFSSTIESVISNDTRFIMDGKNEITISDEYQATGEIPLVRAAAKIALDLNIYSEIKLDKNTIYVPQTIEGAINLAFYNGVKTYGMTDIERFDVDDWYGLSGKPNETTKLMSVTFDPFYSYPIQWSNNDEFEPYLLLEIKWGEYKVNINDINYNSYYYKIPVNRKFTDDDGNLCLLRNNLYKLSLNVGVLGSTDPNAPVELDSQYEILEWGDLNINTSVLNFKYLVVEPTELSIYNESDAQFTFASSHDVTVTVNKIEYDYYGKATTRKITITSESKSVTPSLNTFSDSNSYADYTIKNGSSNYVYGNVELSQNNNGVIDFQHIIKENTFVPHTIYLTVKHKGDNSDTYKREVKIIQYPPIYIIGAQSNGEVFVNESSYSGHDSYIYVNDDNSKGIGSISNPDGISGKDDAINQNKNLYDVHVTVLPSTMGYVIGDPRESTGGSLTNIYELENYRPTRTNATNVIAPIFKIASSYGKTTAMSYAQAKKRCASYQENGYPAGRWRIPTPAEIEFMQQRVLNNDIPSMFNGNTSGNGNNRSYTGYWASNEKVYWPGYDANGNPTKNKTAGFYDTTGMNNNSHAVRCVYDVWYWGNENTGQMASTYSDEYQLTHAVWGDTGSVIVK